MPPAIHRGLVITTLTSSGWRVTPVLWKMAFNVVRAVPSVTPSSAAASLTLSPATKRSVSLALGAGQPEQALQLFRRGLLGAIGVVDEQDAVWFVQHAHAEALMVIPEGADDNL